MNAPTSPCEIARGAIHRQLDGEPLVPAERESLAVHLEGCAGCREARGELEQVQQALASLPELPLPSADLEAVFDRTTRRRPRFWQPGAWGLEWRLAAAAAMVALAAFVLWPQGEPRPSAAEIRQAEAEARLVFKLTFDALKRTQRVAVDEVLGGEVSPALQRVPMKLPGPPAEDGSDT